MRLRTGAVGITYLTTMLLQLADEGAVTLDDPIARWYPELPRAGDGAVIPEPVLHAYTTERGPFEDSTYWNPSWTTASGAILTSDICDLEISARAVGTGRLLSERARREILDPGTVGLGGPTSTCPDRCPAHVALRRPRQPGHPAPAPSSLFRIRVRIRTVPGIAESRRARRPRGWPRTGRAAAPGR
jgi:hypothetical protein